MKLIDELIADLNFDAPVRDIRQGVFHTGVWTKNCGLAATLPKDALKQEGPLVTHPGEMLDWTPRQLANLAYSESLLEASMGMATINSLMEIDDSRCVELNAFHLIAKKGQGKKVVVVGHFPFIPKLQKQVGELAVLEKNPKQDDHPEQKAKSLIPEADVVAITGTAITNHTLTGLLDLCKPDAFVLLLGDSTPLSHVLFDYGVDAVSGTKVIDPDTALKYVSQGANFRQIQGIQKLTLMK